MANFQEGVSILSSALLLHCALTWPSRLGFCVFLFLIPLFFQILYAQRSFSFLHGCFWGFSFFSMHGFSYWIMLFQYGYLFQSLLCIVSILTYCCTISGIWFLCACRLPTVIGWSGASTVYFYFIDRWFFLICGCTHGYSLSFPLLALMEYPSMMQSIPIIGKYGLLFCTILAGLSCVYFCVLKKKQYGVLALVCLSPFLFSSSKLLLQSVKGQHVDINMIEGLTLSCAEIHSPLDRAQEITRKLQEKKVRGTGTLKCVIAPESAYPFDLYKNTDLISLLSENETTNELYFIFGAHRSVGHRLFNSLFVLYRGRIIFCYDKITTVPLAETSPFERKKKKNFLFPHKEPFFAAHESKRLACELVGLFSFTPFICSDLFFENGFSSLPGTAALVIVNEHFFPFRYIQRLMLLHAALKALEWQTDVIYCGYQEMLLIDKRGERYSVQGASVQ